MTAFPAYLLLVMFFRCLEANLSHYRLFLKKHWQYTVAQQDYVAGKCHQAAGQNNAYCQQDIQPIFTSFIF